MDELITIHSLSRDEKRDPRTVAEALENSGLEPVARLHSQSRKPFLWNRADAIAAIIAGLREASKRKR